MPNRKPTPAAVTKQLKSVATKLAGKTSREERLDLLRKQAHLGDQRDAEMAERAQARAEEKR